MTEERKTIFPILIALLVALLPHIGRLPLWINLWCALLWGYLLLSLRFNWPLPGKNIRRGMTLIGIAGLFLTYGRHPGQGFYLGLMAVMAALKVYEIDSHRDRMITVLLAYFIVITSLFLSETLLITIYTLFSVTITTAAMIRINDPTGRFMVHLKLAVVMMSQAIPLMVVLFLLFPRIEGNLFGLSFAHSGKSGFSNNLAPGTVTNLVKDDEVAFRAKFKGDIPPARLLYWRGIVFQGFDGKRWHAELPLPGKRTAPAGKNPISYTVTMEPSHRRWLFALEMPANIPGFVDFYKDFTLRTRRRINQKFHYKMTANTSYRITRESSWTLRKLTRIPEGSNPKTVKLVRQLTRDSRTEDEKVDRILDYFRAGGFSYTLQPPLLGSNFVDDFLFKSKKGYCEHYACAFAFMMRALDIPARIVGGYQGGEVNPYANYLIVSQSDAHVWVEVWHPDKGWVRTDPTAIVAPERISGGVENALAPWDLPDFLARRTFGSMSAFIEQARLRWDAISTGWSAIFEGYSYYEQKALLKKIGIASGFWDASIKAFLVLLVVTGLIFGAYAFFELRAPRKKKDAVKKYYALFCDKLARAGFERKSNQGPMDYATLVYKRRPDLKNRIMEITQLYIRLRYQKKGPETVAAEFIKKVKEFNPVLK